MSNNSENKTDKVLLMTVNHRYFVRQTISTFCGLIIISLMYLFILIMCQPNLERARVDSTYASTGAFVTLASLGYLILVVVQIGKLISLHGKVTTVEKEEVTEHIAKKNK